MLWAVGALSAEYWELPGVGVEVLLSGVVAAAVVLGTVGALSAGGGTKTQQHILNKSFLLQNSTFKNMNQYRYTVYRLKKLFL